MLWARPKPHATRSGGARPVAICPVRRKQTGLGWPPSRPRYMGRSALRVPAGTGASSGRHETVSASPAGAMRVRLVTAWRALVAGRQTNRSVAGWWSLDTRSVRAQHSIPRPPPSRRYRRVRSLGRAVVRGLGRRGAGLCTTAWLDARWFGLLSVRSFRLRRCSSSRLWPA